MTHRLTRHKSLSSSEDIVMTRLKLQFCQKRSTGPDSSLSHALFLPRQAESQIFVYDLTRALLLEVFETSVGMSIHLRDQCSL